jgi:hypothetical protein
MASFVPTYDRIFLPRKSVFDDTKNMYPFYESKFRYPFEMIGATDLYDEWYGDDSDHTDSYSYTLEKITKTLLGQPSYDAGPFPSNISKWIWSHCDQYAEVDRLHETRPGEKWHLFCKLDSGLFAFYSADCTVSGLTWNGSMSLYLSHDPSILITYAMTDAVYSLYESETTPSPCWDPWDDDTAARRLAWAMIAGECLDEAAVDLLSVVGKMIQ